MNKIQEFKQDKGTFEQLMEFIEICEKYDLQSKHKITIDAYNKSIYALDRMAEKYKLHDEQRREWDVWYEHHYMFPKMKEFFDKEKEPTEGEKNAVIFYIETHKACSKYLDKEEHDLEWCAIETILLREIEENLKFFSCDIKKYNWERAGVSEYEAVEVYLGTLAKEILGIDCLWENELWTDK